jgi:hypothetical protein
MLVSVGCPKYASPLPSATQLLQEGIAKALPDATPSYLKQSTIYYVRTSVLLVIVHFLRKITVNAKPENQSLLPTYQ